MAHAGGSGVLHEEKQRLEVIRRTRPAWEERGRPVLPPMRVTGVGGVRLWRRSLPDVR